MKRMLAAITVIISCATGHAGMWWTNSITGAVAPQPTYRTADAVGAPAGYFMEPGWQLFDLAQQAAHDAAQAAAQSEAEKQAAQYADVQPAVHVPRFKGTLTNVVGLSQQFVDDDTDESVFVDETGSPEHTQAQKQAQHDARKAERAAALSAVETAGKNGKVNDRLEAIEEWIRSHK